MDKYNYKILVIEDDQALRKSLVETLSAEGFGVAFAKDGAEGLSSALSIHPDLILLDIAMPRMDGMTMMKKLRQSDDWGKKVPVILLTNLDVDDKILKGVVEDEPSYYLLKSQWSPAGALQRVKEVLGIITPESINNF